MVKKHEADWDERALLLLGALMVQSRHGYGINDFIESCRVTVMKKPTAYAILGRLAAAGYITERTEQVGNRPPRAVYSITGTGRELFYRLLRENLGQNQDLAFAGDIGLMFIDYLPREEALEYLKQQLAERNAELDNFPQALPPDHAGHLSIQLAFDHLLTMRRANRDWLAATIERLAQSEQH